MNFSRRRGSVTFSAGGFREIFLLGRLVPTTSSNVACLAVLPWSLSVFFFFLVCLVVCVCVCVCGGDQLSKVPKWARLDSAGFRTLRG